MPFDSEFLFYGFRGGIWIDQAAVSIVSVTGAWGEMFLNPYPESLLQRIPMAAGSFLPVPANLDFEDDGLDAKCRSR